MTPKFLITLERAGDYQSYTVLSNGVPMAGDHEELFDDAMQFEGGREAEVYAEQHFPEWQRTIAYMGIGAQEAIARSKS